ncbi:hypothetical protein HOD96_02355 [Candidatus Falkowbacteria bacterium]|jgi:hypothetical protein|nr:hypothetical protein [Candidatus Falkowbacteria bacterium]MBT4433451.1 hypothetical protein [Candidatus Falkowbacteria bacterium]
MNKICKKCVLPESRPNIYLNDQEIYNVCLEDKKQDKEEKLLKSLAR